VIKKKKASAGDAHVVDVGTGSGLLAMMAATAGADTVVACSSTGMTLLFLLHDDVASAVRWVCVVRMLRRHPKCSGAGL